MIGTRSLRHMLPAIIRKRVPGSAARRHASERALLPDVNGYRMIVGTTLGIGPELIEHRGARDPIETRLLPMFVRPGDRILDLGANIGFYSLQLAGLAGDAATIVAVEPHPQNISLLKLNLALNKFEAVQVVQAAVGNEEGESTLYVARSNTRHSLEAFSEAVGGIQVSVYTIDSLVERFFAGERIDLIRMDIEGYEHAAFAGAVNTLSRWRPRIVMEFHVRRLGREGSLGLLREFERFGYQVAFAIPGYMSKPWVTPPYPIFGPFPPSELLDRFAEMKEPNTYALFLSAARDGR